MSALDIGGHHLVALLGPTNTGKTWRAIERMLEHGSGMMGLPLRLLAREVYDRVTERVGEDRTALVTGEERRIGRSACYWICTTEAMPVDRPVDFLAVDEIQLAGDRNRGHVFTDRLLHARGLRETFFMGSDTIAPLFKRLYPHGEIRQYQRLSQLTYRGPLRTASLPKRTAVVAFSVERVYTLAEELRRRHGGTAVVLGALSPRTRNAQVAMYQAGEVQYMVATDAIGMGLNMDIDHVAFDRLHKFDGKQVRGLWPQEVAQIAGRAGRFRKDGTFGGTEAVGDMAPALIEAVSGHRFPPLKKLFYRNPTLDFSSPAALLASLRRPAPWPFLIEAQGEEDEEALRALALDPEISGVLASGSAAEREEALRQVWEVCRVPDFRKTLTDSHHRMLKELLLDLRRGPLRPESVERQIRRLDRPEGDVDALTTRMAWIRTWTYITHRSGWLERPEEGQRLAREVEDRLSDALHAQLTARFVDPSARILQSTDRAVRDDRLRIGGVEAGALAGLCFTPDPAMAQDRRLERLMAQEIQPEIQRRLARLLSAPHEAIRRDGLTLTYQGGPLARLQAGPSLLEPKIVLVRNDALGPGDQAQLQRRLTAWLRDEWGRRLGPLGPDVPVTSRPLRALIFRLRESLGSLPRAAVADSLAEFTPQDWSALRNVGLRVGEVSAWAPDLLSAEGRSWRAALASLHLSPGPPPDPIPDPDAGWTPKLPDEFYLRCGYLRVHALALRVEQVEQIAERVRALWKRGASTPEQLDEIAGSRPVADAVLALLRQNKPGSQPQAKKTPRR